jgi:formate hydrogenlyase transcriptional activator
LDVDGRVVAWYAGAERIYGYKSGEVIGRHVSLYPDEDALHKLQEKLKRAASEGHVGAEGWQVKKNGSRFWANVIITALKDENGDLQGFASVVRDFTDRHQRDERLRRGRARLRPLPADSAIPGILSGEFDRIPEANDAFLELVGYSREDLQAGRLHWPDLTPPEYLGLDELAHEEGLRFGACTPFETAGECRRGSRRGPEVRLGFRCRAWLFSGAVGQLVRKAWRSMFHSSQGGAKLGSAQCVFLRVTGLHIDAP